MPKTERLDPNRLLIVGTDGRANAVGLKLHQDNPYLHISSIPASTELNEIARIASDARAGLTWVSPEAPLATGIVDQFHKDHLPIVGPTMEAARLEWDKAWAIRFADRHGIPHPKSVIVDGKDEAFDYIKRFYKDPESLPFPDGLVIKYPLLAAGKGVTLPDTLEQATLDLEAIFNGKYGQIPDEVVFQERIIGKELSMMFLSDGLTVVPLLPARDYKRAYDGDKGPNTGGMGSFAPVDVSPDVLAQGYLMAEKTVRGMALEGIPFEGTLYLGLMLDKSGKFQLLEDNVRFGDPEIQSILALMRKKQLLNALRATTNITLRSDQLRFNKGYAVTVVVAAGNYPEGSSKGQPIIFPESLSDGVTIFPSGIKSNPDGTQETNGGRIAGVTAKAETLEKARKLANGVADQVVFEGARHRSDIAAT